MLKKIMMASIAVGALTLGAPVASAGHVEFDCSFDSVRQQEVTDQTYEGVAAGYAADAEGGVVGIQCVIRVNGNYVAATPAEFNSPAAVTSAQVSFSATADDDVDICARVWSHGSSTYVETCFQGEHSQVPPQVVYDTIDPVMAEVWNIVDPIACEALKLLAPGGPGFVVNGEGDVWIVNPLDNSLIPFFDCPPYLMDWDGDGQPG